MPRSKLKRLVVWGTAAVLLAGALPASAGPSRTRRARVATRYLARNQASDGSIAAFSKIGSTADAALALVAARRGAGALDDALDYLRDQVRSPDSPGERVDTVGEKSKVVLAAVAGGRNPRHLGGRNLVREIKRARRAEGRYGRATPVFDHALAILALEGAGARSLRAAARWLAAAQCGDGGWQFDRPARRTENRHCSTGKDDDFFASDTNTTSYAVQALAVSRARTKHSPFRFFRRARDEVKRGWGYDRALLTDANSTSLVLQAYAARGRTRPKGAQSALAKLQYRRCGKSSGAFAFTWLPKDNGGFRRSGRDLGATIGAIAGLLERPLPIRHYDVTRPAPRVKACR